MDRAALLSLEDSMKNINVYHIGLSNVSNRLKLHFGEEAGIRIKSKKHMGSVVEFLVPEQKEL